MNVSIKSVTFNKAIIIVWFLSYIAGIPYKAIPLSPIAVLLVLIAFGKRIQIYFSQFDIFSRKILLYLFFLVVIRYYILYFCQGHNEPFNFAHISYLINIIVFGYLIAKGQNYLAWSVKIILIAFSFSMIIYLCSSIIGGPFLELGHYLYGRFITSVSPETAPNIIPRGLTAWPHIFGYHMLFLFVYAMASLFENNKISYPLFSVVIGCGLTLLLLGERSTLFSSVVVLCFYLLYRLRSILLLKRVFIIIVAVILTVFLSDFFLNFLKITPLFKRVQEYQMLIEAQARVDLQKYAFALLLRYPQGLLLGGIQWDEAIVEQDPSIFSTWGRAIAPHNGYLTFALPLGLMYFIGILILLYYLIARTLSSLKNKNSNLSKCTIYVSTTFAFFAVLLNAIWHNSSLFSLEQATTLSMFLLLSYQSHQSNLRRNAALLR